MQIETDECFQDLYLEDGSKTFPVHESAYYVMNTIKLPKGLICERCVLRWHYKAGELLLN